jgi:hypothetical protein
MISKPCRIRVVFRSVLRFASQIRGKAAHREHGLRRELSR